MAKRLKHTRHGSQLFATTFCGWLAAVTSDTTAGSSRKRHSRQTSEAVCRRHEPIRHATIAGRNQPPRPGFPGPIVGPDSRKRPRQVVDSNRTFCGNFDENAANRRVRMARADGRNREQPYPLRKIGRSGASASDQPPEFLRSSGQRLLQSTGRSRQETRAQRRCRRKRAWRKPPIRQAQLKVELAWRSIVRPSVEHGLRRLDEKQPGLAPSSFDPEPPAFANVPTDEAVQSP